MPQPRYVAKAATIIPRTFNAEATITRKSVVADNFGGQVDTYTTTGTYPCSFARTNITPREAENAITAQLVVIFQFVFALGTDIRTTDRLTCQERNFEVVSAAGGSQDVATRVICVEIT